ncbi:hypothetical protein SLS62_003892 [Diatrype stigma]|uniref:RING-type domain-containing protein n=1 Tax=Diatrype stigma TaxID=117547 RepID=A0AAN9UVH9_9PEZI
MFLSGFLGSSLGRNDSSSSPGTKQSRALAEPSDDTSRRRSRSPDVSHGGSLYISDESQLRPIEPPPRQIADLNGNLEVLATLFPDVQIEVFREMLSSFSEESRIEIVTDLLLRNPGAFVKGRRRATSTSSPDHRPEQQQDEITDEEHLVPRNEAFRDARYKEAVRNLAMQEFKGLSRSSIDAVLSEWNHAYLDARPTLVELFSKSWKFTISSMLFRRKPLAADAAETHPLVVWKSTGNGSIVPTIKATGSAELDRELFAELIVPLQRRERTDREEKDRALALALHTEEAEACDATYECGCCFTEATFEEFTTCSNIKRNNNAAAGEEEEGEGDEDEDEDEEVHMICFRCVQHSIKEAVFGQGWQRSIDRETGTLRCPAVCSSSPTGCCAGRISSQHMQRAMLDEPKGFEILHKLDQRLAEHDLVASGLPLIRCPFCHYAEVDDIYTPADSTTAAAGGSSRWRPLRLCSANIPNLVLTALLVVLVLLPLGLLVPAALGVFALAYCVPAAWSYIAGHASRALQRHRRRRRGLRFTCAAAGGGGCGRSSCLGCGRAWRDPHVCHESSLVALRTQVEQAMSLAVKRVCPRCATGFVKAAGCNKLTCPCGYRMCYVCRADLGADGYRHFCQHFRPEGDGSRCAECARCNLWEAEDVDAVLRQARADAVARWRDDAENQRELSDAERAYLQDAVGSGGGAGGSPGGDGVGGGGSVRSPPAARKRPGLLGRLLAGGRKLTMEEFCDLVIEALFA